jgi:origin recognition complex subunit 2
MKRKKQPSGNNDELQSLKRHRSGTRETSVAEVEEDDYVIAETTATKGRSSKAADAVEEQEPTPDITESVEGSEEGRMAQDGYAEEESSEDDSEDVIESATPRKTPTSRLNGTPSNNGVNGTTPSELLGKNLFATPIKLNGTPRLERHADRSARRKSTRTLIERTVLGNTSDNDEEDEDIAQHIYGFEEEDALEEPEALEVEAEPSTSAPTTPSKRGRKKGSKNRKRSPTPPQDLPPHELYFFENRSGRPKTSNNNLSGLKLLDHEEFFKLAREYENPHAEDLDFRQEIHAKSFNQWEFELSQDFNLCLYGWGSKRSLLIKFAEYIYKSQTDHVNRKIVVVNGYVRNLTVKDVLNTVVTAIAERGTKLGSQPAEMLENLVALLEQDPSKHITLILHSIDGPALRRPTNQSILSQLSSHPQINLVASADHPSFPLLWDSSLRSAFNFLFHDCTTFQPYIPEVDVVDEVHELLGRRSRRVGGKEGVIFVLKSLPEKAQQLFKVLILEQLAAMDEDSGAGFGANDDDDEDDDDEERTLARPQKMEPGVEWRVLYQKVVEEFICSNEMNFRTLLKE